MRRAFATGRLWQGASSATARALANSAQTRAYDRGSFIALEGDLVDRIGLVACGHVRGVHYSPSGRPITISTLWPGDVFGLMALTSAGRYLVDYQAAEDSTVAFISSDDLHRAIRSETRLMLALVEEFGRQLHQLATVIKLLSLDVPGRVAVHLLDAMDGVTSHSGARHAVDLGMSRVELAARLGTVPETLSRAFHQLQEQGIIASDGRGRVVILDSQRLSDRARAAD